MKESMHVHSMGRFCSRVGGLMKIFTQAAVAMSLRDLTSPHTLAEQHAAQERLEAQLRDGGAEKYPHHPKQLMTGPKRHRMTIAGQLNSPHVYKQREVEQVNISTKVSYFVTSGTLETSLFVNPDEGKSSLFVLVWPHTQDIYRSRFSFAVFCCCCKWKS